MRCAKVIVGDGLDHDYVRPTPSKFVAYVYNELCVAVENKLSVHVYRNATQLLVYMSGRNAMILFAYLSLRRTARRQCRLRMLGLHPTRSFSLM